MGGHKKSKCVYKGGPLDFYTKEPMGTFGENEQLEKKTRAGKKKTQFLKEQAADEAFRKSGLPAPGHEEAWSPNFDSKQVNKGPKKKRNRKG